MFIDTVTVLMKVHKLIIKITFPQSDKDAQQDSKATT